MSSNSGRVCVKLGLKYQGKWVFESWLTEERVTGVVDFLNCGEADRYRCGKECFFHPRNNNQSIVVFIKSFHALLL